MPFSVFLVCTWFVWQQTLLNLNLDEELHTVACSNSLSMHSNPHPILSMHQSAWSESLIHQWLQVIPNPQCISTGDTAVLHKAINTELFISVYHHPIWLPDLQIAVLHRTINIFLHFSLSGSIFFLCDVKLTNLLFNLSIAKYIPLICRIANVKMYLHVISVTGSLSWQTSM